MHKKFVMRSRLEARDVDGKMSALQTELERLRGLHTSTEEQLRGRRCTQNKNWRADFSRVSVYMRLGAHLDGGKDRQEGINWFLTTFQPSYC